MRGPPGKFDTKLFNIMPGDLGPTRSSITMVEKTMVGTWMTVSASMEDVVIEFEGKLEVNIEVGPINLGEVACVVVVLPPLRWLLLLRLLRLLRLLFVLLPPLSVVVTTSVCDIICDDINPVLLLFCLPCLPCLPFPAVAIFFFLGRSNSVGTSGVVKRGSLPFNLRFRFVLLSTNKLCRC